MKSLITGLFTLLSIYFSVAQITFDPDVILLDYVPDDYTRVKVFITNTGPDLIRVNWMFEKGENFPEEWEMSISDANLNYASGVLKGTPQLLSSINPNDSITFYIRVNTNYTEGASYGILHLFSDAECENLITSTSPPSLSLNEKEIERLAIYPNPAQEYFKIRNDENINAIEILNNVGQVFLQNEHNISELHSITSLPSGPYFVVLKDREGSILDVVSLLKN